MKYDCTLVLGDMMNGSRMSPDQVQRLDAARGLYLNGKAKKIITSAGIAPWFNKTKKSLARHGRIYLIKLGLPAKDVLMQERPLNTITECIAIKRRMRARGWHSLIIITSDYHMPRTKKIAKIVLRPYKLKFIATKTKNMTAAMVAEQNRRWKIINRAWLNYFGYRA
jgi:uncharacterized SAM-binding protein YcdF (DUF218 family)